MSNRITLKQKISPRIVLNLKNTTAGIKTTVISVEPAESIAVVNTEYLTGTIDGGSF